MDELIGIALELFFGFICLFILTKFLGRATITQLTTKFNDKLYPIFPKPINPIFILQTPFEKKFHITSIIRIIFHFAIVYKKIFFTHIFVLELK